MKDIKKMPGIVIVIDKKVLYKFNNKNAGQNPRPLPHEEPPVSE
jgi:hypothetical protein